MKNIIKIAKYEKTNDVFNLIGFDDFEIMYLKSNKVHQLRVIVNGRITERKINIVDFNIGYKDIILSAISDYKNNRIKNKDLTLVKKGLKLDYLQQFYKTCRKTNSSPFSVDWM